MRHTHSLRMDGERIGKKRNLRRIHRKRSVKNKKKWLLSRMSITNDPKQQEGGNNNQYYYKKYKKYKNIYRIKLIKIYCYNILMTI
jgi:hypothetical protein